jgi:hypothetical protein
MYWTMAQMLTHHASNGCNLRAGDLLASGTVSGADKTARGCLLELTSRGKDPVTLPTGERRKFLEDGDEIILRGFCERDGFRRIGLGSCLGGDSTRFRDLTSLHSPSSGMLLQKTQERPLPLPNSFIVIALKKGET